LSVTASVACAEEADVEAGVAPSEASTSTTAPTTRTVLIFIVAPFYDGLRRAGAPSPAAAGRRQKEGEQTFDREHTWTSDIGHTRWSTLIRYPSFFT
jgi:hypothetical protein